MTQYKDIYFKKINEYEDQLVDDLKNLVKINSIRDMETKHLYAPFGNGIRGAFNQMIYFSRRDNFYFEDFDGYAMHICMGYGKEEIGVLGHLDIVHEGEERDWDSPPFKLTKRENHLYGRGVNDDKGPVIAAYYALKIIRDLNLPLKRKIKLILGGAEETTWECMKYYFDINKQPTMAFSPDGDFPIVNGEKGIIKGLFSYESLQSITEKEINFSHKILNIKSEKQWSFVCENVKVNFHSEHPIVLKSILTHANKVVVEGSFVTAFYKGKKTLSRNPHKGKNIIFKLVEDLSKLEKKLDSFSSNFLKIINDYFFLDVYGKKLDLYTHDKEMGHTTLCITYLFYKQGKFEIGIDYRYPKSIQKQNVFKKMKAFSQKNDMVFKMQDSKDLLYINPESKLIKSLSQGYKNITDEKAYCLTKGGASYARVLDNGVAFGPTFSKDIPNSHKPNENINISTLKNAIAIYCESIRILAT